MGRGHAGKDGIFLQDFRQRFIGDAVEFCTGHRVFSMGDSCLLRNRRCSADVVAGQHDDTDSGSRTVRNRLFRLLSRRVNHSHEPEKYRFTRIGGGLLSKCQDAECICCHGFGICGTCSPLLLCHRNSLSA